MSRAAAEDLPQELWAQILQHIDCSQRLTACALVCQKLARAAAAATQSLYLRAPDSPRCDGFLRWISNHGGSLTSLLLDRSPSPIRQLRCPNLLELTLDECRVQLLPSSSSMGLLHSCPALMCLSLRGPTVLDGAGGPAGGVAPVLAQLQGRAPQPPCPALTT
jgi:hypothetical protein